MACSMQCSRHANTMIMACQCNDYGMLVHWLWCPDGDIQRSRKKASLHTLLPRACLIALLFWSWVHRLLVMILMESWGYQVVWRYHHLVIWICHHPDAIFIVETSLLAISSSGDIIIWGYHLLSWDVIIWICHRRRCDPLKKNYYLRK